MRRQLQIPIHNLEKFSAIADRLPQMRQGKKVAVSTLHRWRTVGCRGVFLKAVRTPSGWCTTMAAVRRFFMKLTIAEHQRGNRTESRKQSKRQERVERELDDFGL